MNKEVKMLCKSCTQDIPLKFAHAISVDICPFCGKELIDTKLQSILNELKNTMENAKDYMKEVEDWLFSNYSFKKADINEVIVDKNQVNNTEKVDHQPTTKPHGHNLTVNRRDNNDKHSQNENNIEVEEQPSTIFTKRAGIINPKNAIDYIRGKANIISGAADPSEFDETKDDEYGDAVFEPETNQMPLTNTSQLKRLFNNSV